jgi:hypothetical protein
VSDIDLWWMSIGIFALVIVVVAVLLGLIVAVAKSIDRQAAGIWNVGKQIAGNTVSIWMLERTNDLLRRTHDDVRRISDVTASIDDSLKTIARGRG